MAAQGMNQRPRHDHDLPTGLFLVLMAMAPGMLMAQDDGPANGQHVEVLNADRWEYDKDLATGAQRLLGHVRFKHENVLMSCDSAHLRGQERVDAFGHVMLTQGDTLRITGDRLEYDGRGHTARMSGEVRLQDPGMELSTGALLYHVKERRAEYGTGARITDKRGGSTLTSRKGSYDVQGRIFHFTDSVRVLDAGQVILTDTLTYATPTGMAVFGGPTQIIQPDAHLFAERGSYDTRTGEGWFTRAGRIISGGQELTGDTLHYLRETGDGEGWGHVSVTDTVNNLVVRGHHGTHRPGDGRSMVTGRAELVMLMGGDSLFLHADTLFAWQDSLSRRRVLARRNVRFFKSDLQGVCDTMAYTQADSLIALHGEPFLWSREDQISGDSMSIKLRDGHAETLHVLGSAFLASQVDTTHFNQVTGLMMTAFFHQDQIVKVVAEGNSRTVYFAKETKDSVEQVTGVNRADCSIITVGLDSGRVSTVSFLTRPTATLYPLAAAPEEEKRLEGFRWNAAARPEDRGSIFRTAGEGRP